MSAEVDWVLDQLGSVVAAQPSAHPLRRVNRDTSQAYRGNEAIDMTQPLDEREAELEQANYVGASFVDRATSPIGTEFDHSIETTVSLRVEGASTGYGHVDPQGNGGVRFDDLVAQIRDALLAGRTYPDAGRDGITYTHLAFGPESSDAASHADYHRYDVDVLFDGFEAI